MILSVACAAVLFAVPGKTDAELRSTHQVIEKEPIEEAGAAELVVEVRGKGDPGKALPVRVVVTASDGSHPDGSGHGVYADGRFYADGAFSIKAPPGTTEIRLTSGPNYVPLEFTVELEVDTRLRVRASLHRWFAPEDRGWYGGDNHVHAQHDPEATVKSGLDYTALQGRANGLSFLTEAGSNVSYEGIDQLSTDTFLLRHAPELRPGCYIGHLNTPGIPHPIPREQYERLIKGPLPVQAVTRAVHELGGAVTYTHPLAPAHQLHWMGAPAIFSDAVLRQCADLFDIDSRQTELLWFAALNLGNRLACSSYTDAALGRLHTASPGDRRVYCHTDEFSYPAIVAALRRGRTFATNGGPLFPFFTIDDRGPGGEFPVVEDRAYDARAEIHSLYPLKSVQLYRNGNVVRQFDVEGEAGETVLEHSFSEAKKSWRLLRVEDSRGNWAITSPIYFEPLISRPDLRAAALLLEISNCTRFIQLRPDFFAHIIATVSPGDHLASVELLKDGHVFKTFTPDMGNETPSGKTPVTELEGEYAPGWVWHPEPGRAVHFQADWPIAESGWYSVRTETGQGRSYTSDSVHFNEANPNSHEISAAHMDGAGARLVLWGYGEEMPLADIKPPYPGDHWWYPRNTFWRVAAVFEGQEHSFSGGKNPNVEALFQKRASCP